MTNITSIQVFCAQASQHTGRKLTGTKVRSRTCNITDPIEEICTGWARTYTFVRIVWIDQLSSWTSSQTLGNSCTRRFVEYLYSCSRSDISTGGASRIGRVSASLAALVTRRTLPVSCFSIEIIRTNSKAGAPLMEQSEARGTIVDYI